MKHSFHFTLFFALFSLILPRSISQTYLLKEINPRAYGVDIQRDNEKSEIARTRYVSFDLPELTSTKSLELSLFPDAVFTVDKVREEWHGENYSWVGQMREGKNSYVILSKSGDAYFGKMVDASLRTFLISYRAPSIYAIQELVSGVLAEEEIDYEIPRPVNENSTSGNPENQAGICDLGSTCAADVVDVMVIYSDSAKNQLGGTNAAAEAAITAAVTEMNTVSTNSGMIHSFNLAYTGEIAYTETNDAYTDLPRLATLGDGFMDDVHPYRYSYQADLVAYISGTSYCGLGYIQTNPTAFSASVGFCVANYSCMTGNLTLSHEFGHNMGLRHDWYVDAAGTTPCTHNHGYVNQAANPASADYTGNSSQRWRTVMGYNNNCATEWGFNCTRLPYWANPSVNYNTGAGAGPGTGNDAMGVITSDPDPADNTYSLNRSICLVAGLSNQLTPLPVNFTYFEAERTQKVIKLSWGTNFELNHAGYEVEMKSIHAPDFSLIGELKGENNSNEEKNYQFKTRELLPGTYHFRLKQIDLDGSATYSKIVTGSIPFDESSFALHVFPNPTNGQANFEISFAESRPLTIELFDAFGKKIKTVFQGEVSAGNHIFPQNLGDLPDGVYLYKVNGGGISQSGKLVHRRE